MKLKEVPDYFKKKIHKEEIHVAYALLF